MGKIEMNDFCMAYEENGQGYPLLLIHGYPLNRQLWIPQIDGLATSAHVIAPDLRGHGDSGSTLGEYSMELHAADCVNLLDHLKIQKAIICGLSMGGYICFSLLNNYSHRIAGAIFSATRANSDTPAIKQNREKSINILRTQGIQPIIESMLPKLVAPDSLKNYLLVQKVESIMQQTSVNGAIGDLLGMMGRSDYNYLLPGISVPCLIIHGSQDQIIPIGESQEMQRAIPNSKWEKIENAGHLLNLEKPIEFNKLVKSFIASIL